MARKDYAILVGISQYPNPGFSPLQGPPRDVERFRQWLIDPQGGDVDSGNIKVIISPEPPLTVDPDRAPPELNDFVAAFKQLVIDDQNNLHPHGESRLYLYFSGHGFCEIDRRQKVWHQMGKAGKGWAWAGNGFDCARLRGFLWRGGARNRFGTTC